MAEKQKVEKQIGEEVLLAFKLYNLAAQTLVRALESGGTTLDEVKASVDSEEQKFFNDIDARIAKLKGN